MKKGFFFRGRAGGWGKVTFNLSLINEALINPTEKVLLVTNGMSLFYALYTTSPCVTFCFSKYLGICLQPKPKRKQTVILFVAIHLKFQRVLWGSKLGFLSQYVHFT